MTYLGVDGGGTKTMLALERDGNITYKEIRSPSNPNDVGFEKSAKSVACWLRQLCAECGCSTYSVDGVFCGIAGGSTADFNTLMQRELKLSFPNAICGSSHDGENIVFAAFPYTDGVAVICGTGSSCFVKDGHGLHRIGGYGRFDMIGNGYEIGKAAIAHSLRCIDGRDKKGELFRLVEQANGADSLSVLGELIAKTKTQLAGYAPLVFLAAESGDSEAVKILERNLDYIAELINTAGSFFKDNYRVCIAGGIGSNPLSMELIKKRITCRSELFALDVHPVTGALNRAKIMKKII